MAAYNFEARESNLTKLLHVTRCKTGINFFGGRLLTPHKTREGKKRQICDTISDNFKI